MRRLLICALLVGCSDSDPAAPIKPNNSPNNSQTNNPTNNGQTNNPTNNSQSNNSQSNNSQSNNPPNNSQSNNPPNNSQSNNPLNNMTDMGEDMSNEVDQGTPDMGFVDLYPNRPLGQCVVSSDCPENPNGKVCNRLLPGGSCGACDGANDLYCDDTCLQGTCVTTCQSNDDCPPGLGCSNGGRCGAVMCNNGQCPFPLFGCSATNRCQRISCEEDANVCPTGTQCVADLCIETRMLR